MLRLTEDLAAAISSRVPAPPSSVSAPSDLIHSGLLSTLSDLFPSGSTGTGITAAGNSASTGDNSLFSVLQNLTSATAAAAAAGSVADPALPGQPSDVPETGTATAQPTFQFSTPPPAFAMVPMRLDMAPERPAAPTDRFAPLPPLSEGGSGGELPDILAPLSPSPDQEPQLTSDNVDDVPMPSEPASAAADIAVALASTQSNTTADASNPSVSAPPLPATDVEAPSVATTNAAASSDEQPESTSGTAAADPGPAATAVAESSSEAGPSGGASGPAPIPTQTVSAEYAAILGDIEIPEGVDPSFLAALPEDMRAEVIEEQRRLLRSRQAPPAPTPAAATEGMAEVNPEFLAALPPNIQAEVLAQQRLEQQRAAAATATDPAAPVDPGEFLLTLTPSLRQSLLAEMEESQISALPAEIAAEAQTLRRDFEQQRNRTMSPFGEHDQRRTRTTFFQHYNHVNHPAAASLSSILRSTVNRMGSYTAHNVLSGGGGGRSSVYSRPVGRGGPQHSSALLAAQTTAKFKGRQMLDHEGLSCLLILLFIDDPRLNTTRLHRILRNLCYHGPTRDWVLKCLLSILEKANCCTELNSAAADSPLALTSATPTPAKLRKSTSKGGGSTPGTPAADNHQHTPSRGGSSSGASQTSWLNISMDAALGFRANVFQVQRPANSGGGKKSASSVMSVSNIKVHPQAAPVVCKNTLEVLISLAKSFSIHFLPSANAGGNPKEQPSDTTVTGEAAKKITRQAEFWETLLKLDRECWTSKKGKSVVRSHSSVGIKADAAAGEGDEAAATNSASASAFGQLLGMLASPVIKRSSLLTDKLLRLLSLISLGKAEVVKRTINPEQAAVTAATATASGSSTDQDAKGFDKAVNEQQIRLAVEVHMCKTNLLLSVNLLILFPLCYLYTTKINRDQKDKALALL